ncbi:hypothetical protein ACFX13_045096 [Malus domestica]
MKDMNWLLYSTGSGRLPTPQPSSAASMFLRSKTKTRSSSLNHRFDFLSTFSASPLRAAAFSSSSSSSSSSTQRSASRRRSAAASTGTRVACSLLKAEDSVNDDETCELVSGFEVSVDGEGVDGTINAYLFKAVKNNNGIGMLLLSDIFGFEDSSTREFAYRIACSGYNVLLPDLFRGDPWTRDRPKIDFEKWIANQEAQRVAKDIAACAKWMVDEFAAAGISNKLGLIGFCYGGGKVIEVLAQDQGAYFGIGVSFYGTRMDDTSVASNVKVPVLFITGDNDPLCRVSVVESIEKTIGRGSRVVSFKGRGHGFAHRPQSFEEDEDAEKAFTLMRNWLHDGLLANANAG